MPRDFSLACVSCSSTVGSCPAVCNPSRTMRTLALAPSLRQQGSCGDLKLSHLPLGWLQTVQATRGSLNCFAFREFRKTPVAAQAMSALSPGAMRAAF